MDSQPSPHLSGRCYFIDIAFPALGLAVEIDGRLHEDDPSIFETDRYRQNNLVSAGWTVLRFTYAMLVNSPDYVIATIAHEVARLKRAGCDEPVVSAAETSRSTRHPQLARSERREPGSGV